MPYHRTIGSVAPWGGVQPADAGAVMASAWRHSSRLMAASVQIARAGAHAGRAQSAVRPAAGWPRQRPPLPAGGNRARQHIDSGGAAAGEVFTICR